MELKSQGNLNPIRDQMWELTQKNCRIIEFGCGNGKLLFKLASKINYGLGVDKSEVQIQKALRLQEEKGIKNIEFTCTKLDTNYISDQLFDTAIASLFFHVIPLKDSISLITKMKEVSDNILICGFCKPKTMQQKTLLWIDQKISNHYPHFNTYKKSRYMEGIFAKGNISNYETFDTHIPFVKIYKTT